MTITAQQMKDKLKTYGYSVLLDDCQLIIDTHYNIKKTREQINEIYKEADSLLFLQQNYPKLLSNKDNKELNSLLDKITVLNNKLKNPWEKAHLTHMYNNQSVAYCRAMEIL